MIEQAPVITELVSDTRHVRNVAWLNWFDKIVKALNDGIGANDLIGTTSLTAGNGGAGALPATPAGFVAIQVNGVTYKVPYYPVS